MSHDRWTDRLSEYIDDGLTPAERAGVEAHLGECAACRLVLAELGGVVARAQRVADRPPPGDLWPAIAARIGAPASRAEPAPVVRPIRSARRLAFSVPQLAAAALVVLVLGGTGGWLAAPLLTDPHPAAAPLPPMALPATPAATAVTSAGGQSRAVTSAIEELEAALAAGRDRLAPSTIRTLEANLATIDTAIAEAQRAVAADPGNAYLQTHLADIVRRKVTLLQHAATLAAAQT